MQQFDEFIDAQASFPNNAAQRSRFDRSMQWHDDALSRFIMLERDVISRLMMKEEARPIQGTDTLPS